MRIFQEVHARRNFCVHSHRADFCNQLYAVLIDFVEFLLRGNFGFYQLILEFGDGISFEPHVDFFLRPVA